MRLRIERQRCPVPAEYDRRPTNSTLRSVRRAQPTLGAAAGGIIGSLVGLGVTEKDARFYQSELEAGRTIITVTTSDDTGHDEAVQIMRNNGAYDAATREGVVNTASPVSPFEGNDPEDPTTNQGNTY